MPICLEAGCPAIVDHGRCRLHARAKEQTRPNIEIRRLYKTARWLALREQVLRDEPLCPECEAEGRITATQDVHHQQKAALDNFFDRSNLQALCHAHHSEHTKHGE